MFLAITVLERWPYGSIVEFDETNAVMHYKFSTIGPDSKIGDDFFISANYFKNILVDLRKYS
jgi:hypothetical protein